MQRWLKDKTLPGLYIRESVTKSVWAVKARQRGFNGVVTVTLGRCDVISANEARKQAKEALALLAQGINPNQRRNEYVQAQLTAKANAEARSLTLGDAIESYLGLKALKPNTVSDLQKCLTRNFPDWLDRPLTSITREDVQQRFQDIKQRVQQRRKAINESKAERGLQQSRFTTSDGAGEAQRAFRYLTAVINSFKNDVVGGSKLLDSKQIFHDILEDLSDPIRATTRKPGPGYVIHSLSVPTKFERGMDPADIDARDFVVRAEEYGVPQARHRVILVGIRSDLGIKGAVLEKASPVTVFDAIGSLPALRSHLKGEDSSGQWRQKIQGFATSLGHSASLVNLHAISKRLNEISRTLSTQLDTGALRYPKVTLAKGSAEKSEFADWVNDARIEVWLNHQARAHMDSDLGRYLFASTFAEVTGRSPRGHEDFCLPGLAPDHANWESGKFVDRFKVQRYDAPSSTITSHISKDGHYFIHPDPAQCRALTVREAARLQTFPDNYFFQGGRTQQYHQVGNAVPPLLAKHIARIVSTIVKQPN